MFLDNERLGDPMLEDDNTLEEWGICRAANLYILPMISAKSRERIPRPIYLHMIQALENGQGVADLMDAAHGESERWPW